MIKEVFTYDEQSTIHLATELIKEGRSFQCVRAEPGKWKFILDAVAEDRIN